MHCTRVALCVELLTDYFSWGVLNVDEHAQNILFAHFDNKKNSV
jgi:hypothetical protein